MNRTTNERGLVDHMTLAEIQALDAGDNNVIPTLHEVLVWAEPFDIGLLLDVKHAPNLQSEKIVEAVAASGLRQRVLFGVRSLSDMKRFARHADGLRFFSLVPDERAIDAFVADGGEV